MQGSVRKKGATWSYRVELQKQSHTPGVWFPCRNLLGDIPIYFLNMYLKYLTSE